MTKESKKTVAAVDCVLSNDVIQLFNSAAVQNRNEAVTVLFHAFLLDSGFIPKDVSSEDKYKFMPKDWNAKGLFKINYAHCCCPTFTCCLTCVPLYNTASVHGIISDVDCPESVDLKVNVSNYLKQTKDFSDALEVFCNVEELSREFKDNFCLPLLNLLHGTIGINPLFGFLGLYDDLKVFILQLLPVEGVMSMSAVNKNLNDLANSSFLWKYLFERDFVKGGIPDVDTSSSETNWKQIYKKEYMKKKRKLEPRRYMFPHYRIPKLFNVGPDFDTDFGINFDPPFPDPSLFTPPFLSPRLPPFFRRLF